MKDEKTTETPQAETRAVASVPTNIETSPEQPLLPGMEELAAENQNLKAELHIRTAVYDIETRLAKAGARSPKLLVEQAKASFQLSDEDELSNAEAVVDHLRKAFPEQFTPDSPPSIDASAGRTTCPTLTKEALARMTTAEIRRLDWSEVRSALAS